MNNEIHVLQADLCKAIAHPTRIQILYLLRHGERCVCEIYPALAIEQPNVSRHLSILKKQGILSSRKQGLKVIYMITDERVFVLLDLITDMLKQQWDSRNKVLL